MPIPAILPAVLSMVQQKKQNFMNMAYDQFTNWQDRNFTKKMYNMQRRDALADWQMMNEYNSPTAQMARFQEAGLNPNLIYGQTNEAAPVRSSSVDSFTPKMTPFKFDTDFMSAFDAQLKTVQTDNVKAATNVAIQDALLRSAQIAATAAGTEQTKAGTERTKAETAMSNFNLEQARNLQGVVLETAQQNLKKLQEETKMTVDRNAREAAANSKSLEEANARIKSMLIANAKSDVERREILKRIENLEKDGQLKQLDIELKSKGLQPGDALWQRKVVEWWENMIKGLHLPGNSIMWKFKIP